MNQDPEPEDFLYADLEALISKLQKERDDARDLVKGLTKNRDRYKSDAERWAKRMRVLENKLDHIRSVIDDRFDIPTINQLRKAQCLEELPSLKDE